VGRRRIDDTSHPDATLTNEYWLRFGDNPQSPMREKIIYLTMAAVSSAAPRTLTLQKSVIDSALLTPW